MVLEASGGCCESIIDGLESPEGCREAICVLLQLNIVGFGISRKLSWSNYWLFEFSRMLLWNHLRTFRTKYWWFWKLQEAAAYPLLMVWNFQEVAVKQFAYFYNEILMVLEVSGGCCESIIDGLESPGGCCEPIYKHWNIDGFGSFRTLLWIQCWWFGISRRLLWSHLRIFQMKY